MSRRLRRWRIIAGAVALLALALPASASADENGGALRPTFAHRPPREIESIWHAATDLEGRIERTRAAALQHGLTNFTPAARSLILAASAPGAGERARGAVRLAPDLPLAHVALARALWQERRDAAGSVAELGRAFPALFRHLEARLWLTSALLVAAAAALFATGGLSLVVAGFRALPTAAHDLGDLLGLSSRVARSSVVGGFLLLPAALGEGLFGILWVLALAALCYGPRGERCALFLAVVCIWLGLHPAFEGAGRVLASPGADPRTQAALVSARGFALAHEEGGLARGADDDLGAREVLALEARRAGDLATADRFYADLRERAPDEARFTNNAANVRLMLGDVEGAITLYERALETDFSPEVLFNLSQAYGKAIRLLDQSYVLAEAQQLDADLISELTALAGLREGPFTLDLRADIALPLWPPASEQGSAVASALRRSLAPGAVGGRPIAALLVLGGLPLLAMGLRHRLRLSARCSECGGSVCGACGTQVFGTDRCLACVRLETPVSDANLREAQQRRCARHRARNAAWERGLALFVPGAFGFLSARPGWGLGLAFLFAAGAALWGVRGGIAPDPLAVGAAGSLFCAAGALALWLFYAVLFAQLARRTGKT